MRKKLPAVLLASILLMPVAGCNKPAENEVAEAPGVPGKGVDRSHKGEAMPDAELFNADDDKAMLADAKGKPTRVGFKIQDDGKKVRVARTTGDVIDG